MRIQIWHVVVLIVAFVLLFGWKNLPNIARSMGESMRVFKSEVDQMKDEGQARNAEKTRPAIEDEDTAMREYREANERRPDEPRA
ncbi:Sec-independent protein translocase subunit TatA [Ornithinimicrobium flavum]|uniref:Sec-independent protein translocase subunit TatA n=1 Tax=Ornithinimicrobium flavum TaxID=1288636 RepID=UPI00106F6F04|nr:Sec-independent protein translocase subunit TatA [Ornithinimicrobium flavum]